MNIEDFGAALLDTQDLDPMYVGLYRWAEGKPRAAVCRWLTAYWCFYSAGVSCWLAEREGDEYWRWMMSAARNELPTPLNGRWPRGRERRHFRAEHAIRAVTDLNITSNAAPEAFVETLLAMCPAPYAEIRRRVCEQVGFGPWIAFKVGDMLERVLRAEIEFSVDEAMYDEPTKAAILHFDTVHRGRGDVNAAEKVAWSVGELLATFGSWSAPPGFDRLVGIQEVETILCKWKAHVNGHYRVGEDIEDITAALKQWASVSPSAEVMLDCMPPYHLPGQLF